MAPSPRALKSSLFPLFFFSSYPLPPPPEHRRVRPNGPQHEDKGQGQDLLPQRGLRQRVGPCRQGIRPEEEGEEKSYLLNNVFLFFFIVSILW